MLEYLTICHLAVILSRYNEFSRHKQVKEDRKMKSKRRIMQEKRRRKQLYTRVSLAGLALVVVALLGYAFLTASRPLPGEAVAVMPDSSHVPEGTDPGPYNTDPPTSGRHYEVTFNAGFYNPGDVQSPHPAGHLVHNLEHGYVIFWYNCSLLSEQECIELKDQIRGVMDAENNLKVIAYPWESTDVPVVMTSWGRMLRFEEFDPRLARDFVQQNRNKAPEPLAP